MNTEEKVLTEADSEIDITELVEAIEKMQQQLTFIERKIDTLMQQSRGGGEFRKEKRFSKPFRRGGDFRRHGRGERNDFSGGERNFNREGRGNRRERFGGSHDGGHRKFDKKNKPFFKKRKFRD